MAYHRTTWISGITPLSADNLNNIEEGIHEAMVRPAYKHCVKMIGMSEDNAYDVYIDLEIYDDSPELYTDETIFNVFEKNFNIKGIVAIDTAYLRIDEFGLQDDKFFVIFGDSEYGFSIGQFSITDVVVKFL